MAASGLDSSAMARMGSSSMTLSKVEKYLFGVLHVMVESEKRSVATATKNGIAAVLNLVDLFQLLMLVWSQQYNWPSMFVGRVAQLLQLYRWVIPQYNWAWFIVGWTLVAMVVCLSMANAVYVAWVVTSEKHQYLWPVRLLSTLVATLVSALFIPTLQMLAAPLMCSQVREEFHADYACWGGAEAMLMVIAVLILALFIPFCLLMTLCYFNDDPISGGIIATPSGRYAFVETVIRIVFIFQPIVLANSPRTLWAVVDFLLISLNVAMVSLCLPLYNLRFNKLRCAALCGIGWISAGSIILTTLEPASDAVYGVSIAFMVLFPAFCALGWRLPDYQARRLRHLALRVRERYDAMATDMDSDTGPANSSARPHRSFAASTQRDGSFVLRSQSSRVPTTPINASLWTPLDPEITSRTLVAHGSPADLRAADLLYNESMLKFPRSTHLAMSYGTFLAQNKTDRLRALTALAHVRELSPALDHKFQLYSSQKIIEQDRYASHLGRPTMDVANVLEYKKHEARALTEHRNALRKMQRMWRHLAGGRVSGNVLVSLLDGAAKSKESAELSYNRLVELFPSVPQILRRVGVFKRDVMLEDRLAEGYFEKADSLEDMEAAHWGSGQSAMTGGSSVLERGAQRRFVPRVNELKAVIKLRRAMMYGKVLSFVLCTCVNLYSLITMATFTASGDNMDISGMRPYSVYTAMYNTRTMLLAAHSRDALEFEKASTAMEAAMGRFGEVHSTLFQADRSFPQLDALYTRQPLQFTYRFLSGGQWTTFNRSLSLWTGGNEYRRMGLTTANRDMEYMQFKETVPRAYANLSDVTFLFQNGYHAQEMFDYAADLYQRQVFRFADTLAQSQSAALGVAITLQLALAGYVIATLGPVLRKMASQTKTVGRLATSVPRRVYMDLLQQVDSAIEALDEEGIDADAERHNGSRQQLDTDAALQPEPGGMDEEGKAHDVQPAPDVMQAAAAVSAALTGAASPGLHTFGSRMSAGDMHADRSPGARHRANPEAKPFRVHQRHGVKFSLVGQEGDKDCGDELDDCGSSGCSGTDSELVSARPDTAQSGAVVLPVVQNVTPDSEAIRQGGGRRGHPVSPAPALGRTVRASVTISAGSKAEPNGAEAGSNATMHDDGSDSEGDGEQPAETPARKAELGMARCWPRCCRSNRVVPLFSTKALASQSKHFRRARAMLSKIVAFACCTVVLSALTYILGTQVIAEGKFFTAELNYAAKRRTLCRSVVFFAREALVDDGLMWSKDRLLRELQTQIDVLYDVHAGLEVGDASLGLPRASGTHDGQFDVLYESSCFAASGACNDTSWYGSLVNNGLDFMVRSFLLLGQEALVRVQERQSRVSTLAEVEQLGQLATIIQMEEMELTQALRESIARYNAAAQQYFSRAAMLHVLLLVGIFIVYVGFYFLVFRSMLRKLRGAGQRMRYFLLMFPEPVIASEPALRGYFKLNEGTA